jgi:hypothetical protein
MTDATNRIALSVVVTTMHEPCAVIQRLDGLRRQVNALAGQLVVVSSAAPGSLPPPDVCTGHVLGGSIFDCRAAALALARGEVVAFTEDHCHHPPHWCARILQNFSARPDLILLGGAVANGSTRRIEDLMNYWMTFATYAPGQVTARHPCIAQFIVKLPAIDRSPKPGEIEFALVSRFQGVPGAIYVDPELIVTHQQSHGFLNTFAAHFHNGRTTGGLSLRRIKFHNPGILTSIWWGFRDSKAHLHRSSAAFRAGRTPFHIRAGYLSLILPLTLAHGIGAAIGYRRGPGESPHHLV